MKSTLHRLTVSGILLLTSLMTATFGRVGLGFAQTNTEWSEPINISNSGASSDPSIVVDNTGVIHVIWVDAVDGYKYVFSPDGSNWSQQKTVNYPFDPKTDSKPRFFLEPSGRVSVFWQDDKSALYHSRFLPESMGNPGSWAGTVKLTNSAIEFDADVDASGNVYLGFVKGLNIDGDQAGVYVRRFNGSSWSTTVTLYASQYFRSLTPENARISVSAYGDNAYVAWDDPYKKQLMMSQSVNGGLDWNNAFVLIGLEDVQGFETPFHVEIDAREDGVLLLWRTGVPGFQCVMHSRWSMDNGERWSEIQNIFSGSNACPDRVDFLPAPDEVRLVLMGSLDTFSLIAWNGNEWSNPQSQDGILRFFDPVTRDPILFRCQAVEATVNRIFVVGCDDEYSNDTWFTSRTLGGIEEWFPPPSAWTEETEITRTTQKITSPAVVGDRNENLHSVWVQSSTMSDGSIESAVEYMKWNGEEWSDPISIFTGLIGIPRDLSLFINNEGLLMLNWVDGNSGDLLFSWSNADRAGIPVEWRQPISLPSASRLNESPDLLVDSSGGIWAAYAIGLNENRGIYIVQSSDQGATWSVPIKVFDAENAGWDRVGAPKISATRDGRIHILFSNYSLNDQSQSALFYTQSLDGGGTWSVPSTSFEGYTTWTELMGFEENIVHRFWQAEDGVTRSTYHEVSRDSGESWEGPVKITSTTGRSSQPAVTLDSIGTVHLIQLMTSETESEFLREWVWTDEGWRQSETMQTGTSDTRTLLLIGLLLDSGGELHAFKLNEIPGDGDLVEYGIAELSRSASSAGILMPADFLIASPIPPSASSPTPEFSAPPVETRQALFLDDQPSTGTRNFVGVLLIVIFSMVILFFLMPRRNTSG